MCTGLLGIAAALCWLANLTEPGGYARLWPPFAILGVSLGLAAISSVQTLIGNAPLRFAGIASAVLSTATQIGGVLGTAVLGSVLASRAAASFALQLGASQLPGSVIAPLRQHGAGAAAQGLPLITSRMPPALADHVRLVTLHAYGDGLRATMYVGAALALLGSSLALFARRGARTTPSVGLL
jgi:hypothetical protein